MKHFHKPFRGIEGIQINDCAFHIVAITNTDRSI